MMTNLLLEVMENSNRVEQLLSIGQRTEYVGSYEEPYVIETHSILQSTSKMFIKCKRKRKYSGLQHQQSVWGDNRTISQLTIDFKAAAAARNL